jgi:hypothetical protein
MGKKRELQRAERERIARLIYPHYAATGRLPWKRIKHETGIAYDRKTLERCLNEFQNVLIQEDIEKRIKAGHAARWEARYGEPYPGDLPPMEEEDKNSL